MTDNEALIAKVIAKARADASDIRDMEHESYHWVAGLIDNLAAALEAATVAPAVDREALTNALGAALANAYDDDLVVTVEESLAAELLASGLLRDVRDVQAEALEQAADDVEPLGYATVTNILRMRAQAIREARPSTHYLETGEQ